MGKVIAAYGGGFKPPTKGHFQVIEDALAKHPEIDEFIIYVGSGTRDGISQLESILVWEVYNNHLPMKVKIEPSKSPIGDIIRLGKNNPQDTVYFIIGSREGNEEDQKDYESRTKNIEEKYPNMEIKLITTSQGEISGTKARKALLISPEEFYKFTPEVLNDNERGEVFDTLRQSITETSNLEDGKSAPFGSGYIEVKEIVNFISLEKTLDDMFEDLGIDINFTTHFKERVIERGLTEDDIVELMEKIYNIYGDEVADLGKNENRVFSHLRRLVDIAAINKGYGDDYLKDLVLKTAYKRKSLREPEFRTNMSSPKLKVNENTSHPQETFQDFFSKEIQHWVNEDIKDYGDLLEYKIDFNNVYDYSTNNNLWEFYDEVNQVKIIAKLKPTSQGVFEFKFYSLQDGKQLSFSRLNHYNPKVMNTIFKIFIDDVLPNNNKILIQPFDYPKYRLFRALINKNISPQNYNIKVKDNIESPVIYVEKKTLNENASYSGNIDYKKHIVELTKHMLDNGMNIKPLPKVIFVNGDSANARQFLGKTAYYNPNDSSIVLYTEGRHPKDIVRSFSHEMIHHIQNLEGRLDNITTTNTQEDDNLNDIEAEANLKGTMTFRNWTDSLNESTVDSKLYPFKIKDKTYDENDNSLITVEYNFTTPSNTYRVEFYSGEYNPEAKTFDLSFGVDRGELNTIDTFQMTGEGNARKIFNTILNIVEDFIDNEDVKKIVVDGTDEKRKRIYKILFSSTPPKISDKIELNEAIVGEKIECDNCDWSWNIVDGGDDLFICHKCGHDNEPITEKTLLEEEDRLMAEVVNPDGEGFEYEESNIKGLYTYKDSRDNLYFSRVFYQNTSNPYFEFKAGWFEDNDISKPKYEPQLPPNTTGMDNLKRRNTVAKIYRDKIIPYFIEKSSLSNQLIINPISDLRYTFLKRLVQNYTPKTFEVQYDDKDKKFIKILSKKIEEKKSKDPFGLNQYARELASDLEEEMLNEGRYDKITNQVSREVFAKFKEIYDSGAKEGNFTFSVGPDDEEIFSEDLEFNLEGYIEVSDEMYQPDGGANAGYDDDGEEITPLIQVSFKIPQDPKEFKWSEVSFDIKDIVRHEIEHLTQDGENIKSGKYLEDDQLIRRLIDADMLPKSQYFKLEKEVDAMLQGLYFRAKKSKTPFKVAILDYFKRVGLTKEEQKQILNIWRGRRKALALPTFENISN
jgi:hypothetical protein